MIKIEKLTKQHKNFGFKLFFSYIIFTILLIITITIIHIYFSHDLQVNKFIREVKLQSDEKKDKFDKYFKTKKDAISAIAKNEYFIEYVNKKTYSDYIELLFFTLIQANKDYMQIRYIDEKGFEVLRFDRQSPSSKPFKSNLLQNKSNRYYFKDVSKMEKNDIWLSNIDLNVEHGVVENPNKPVVRVATPIFIKKKFKGILIINIFMDELLEYITTSALFDIYLIDYNGYYIRHKNKNYNWSYYNSKKKVENQFGKELDKLIKTNENNFLYKNNIFGQSLHLDRQKITMLYIEKKESLNKIQSNNNKMIVTILIFATIMSILFTLIFTRALKGLFELVILQANKLHDLASNLDNKVILKTLELAKKDRLLQNQSKLAELGDMIGNIAHQWRHPLTRLSLTIQNLKAFKNKEKMTDEIFHEAMESSLYQIEFMSNTIDNFKDFYKKDEKKSTFKIKEAVENTLNIIGSILEHKNINITINCKDNLELYANKNEFSQVLMNIMINAKDAITEKKELTGKIDINIYKENDYKIVEIKDNGNGVPSCFLDEIFNPYFTTKEDKGTGIGLYLCKAIIEDKMNGKIQIKNDNGAVFKIKLKS